jgi:hypothetical protein
MLKTTARRIQRSATAAGNLVSLNEPVAVSLVGRPANQRPFVVMRSADAAPTDAGGTKRVLRTKRNDSPVLALKFPEGSTEATVTEALTTFGMANYTIALDEATGTYHAFRSDLQSIANIETTDIMLNKDGVIASLDATQYKVKRADSKQNIKLVSFEFDIKRFDEDAISSWMAQNGVDSAKVSVENSSGDAITVKRSDVEEGTDVRRVELEAGVVAVVARSDVADLPAEFALTLSDAAYGSWGWGHLEFNVALADEAFCQLMDDAAYRLCSVMRHITMQCELPLESRKELVARSLAQYQDFVSNVIDALPRQVMVLVTRADVATKESNNMKTEDQSAAPAAAAAAPATPEVITRADLDAAVAKAVTAALAAQAAPAAAADTTQRSDAAAPAAAAPAEPVAAAVAPAAAVAGLTRADLDDAVSKVVSPLIEQISTLQNTVVLRSDSGDQKQAGAKPANIFRGSIFGNLGK